MPNRLIKHSGANTGRSRSGKDDRSKNGASSIQTRRSSAASKPKTVETQHSGGVKPAQPSETRRALAEKGRRSRLGSTLNGGKSVGDAQRVSKSQRVVSALQGEGGATLQDLMKLTGWQAHSVRGFLSGTVRKKLGLDLKVEVGSDGIKRYRLDPVGPK
ncbi:MAG: DUF3489 domain-containing protein [Pseudomonadota bacterium]